MRGADIMNHSWGVPQEGFENDDIADAIETAINEGRNGKGCIIVKSAGNTGSHVTFPGTVPGVLVVGAVDRHNEPWYYTPQSNIVDIIAPSGDLSNPNLCDYNGDVWSTDLYPGGYSPCDEEYYGSSDGKYYSQFGGTSAAAPQASGVAALILSINPNLTELQVRNIIKQSATSYGQTNWAGYGRLNAYMALIASQPISGSSVVCDTWLTYVIQNVPDGASVSWDVSTNLEFDSFCFSEHGPNTSCIIVRAINSMYNETGSIEATININDHSYIIERNIWIGKPDMPHEISNFEYNGKHFASGSEYQFGIWPQTIQDVDEYYWDVEGGTIESKQSA